MAFPANQRSRPPAVTTNDDGGGLWLVSLVRCFIDSHLSFPISDFYALIYICCFIDDGDMLFHYKVVYIYVVISML